MNDSHEHNEVDRLVTDEYERKFGASDPHRFSPDSRSFIYCQDSADYVNHYYDSP